MRLVKHEASLLPPQGFELHPHQDSAALPFSRDTTYAIPFDMKIAGWLPQSFENDTVALSYGLIATVKVEWVALAPPKNVLNPTNRMDVDQVMPSSSSPVPIMSAASPTYASRFFPRLKSVASALATAMTLPISVASHQVVRASDWQPITIIRHRVTEPPCVAPSATGTETAVETPLRHYTLRPAANSPSPVECVVSVPETIDINGPTLRVSVRLRARDGFTIAGVEGEDPVRPSTSTSAPESGDDAASAGVRSSAEESSASPSLVSPAGNVPCPKQGPLEHIRMVELGMEVEETERYS